MRALFTFAGGAGHLNPLLPVAEAVVAAGHEVAFSGKPSVVALAERAGYTVFGTGDENDAARSERGSLEPIDRERERRVLRDGFARRIAGRRLTELLEVADAWRPDLLVCDETDFGGTLAAEQLGLPHATMLVNASGSFVQKELLAGMFDVDLLARHLVLSPRCADDLPVAGQCGGEDAEVPAAIPDDRRGPRRDPRPEVAAFLARPERAEIYRRVAGLPAREEPLDRRMQHDVVELLG